MDNLLELLENEYAIYEEILSLSKKKTDIVVQGKVSELDHIVKLEQALVLQTSKIEKKKIEIMANFTFDKRNWNITALKEFATPEQEKKLEDYQNNMKKLLTELNQVNQLNSKLITNSLEFIEFSLNLFSAADVTSNNYGSRGDSSNREKKNLFDIRL